MKDRRTRSRRKLNRGQKWLAAIVVVIVLMLTTGFLWDTFGKAGHKSVSTTPECLKTIQRGSFCTGVALKAVSKKELGSFTAATGLYPALVEYYQAFGNSFSKESAVLVGGLGARPFIQLNPHNVSMQAIIDGKYDHYLDTYAKDVKAFGHGVVLSFGHEMNGTWSTWSLPFTQPSKFVAAWRHIVKRFEKNHVKNVTWAWDISHIHKFDPRKWYPGNKYVDWVGIDGYLRPGQTFAGQFYQVVHEVRHLSHNKPILITETAVAPSGEQISQIHELFDGARKMHLVGLIWFNVNKKEDWNIEQNKPALAAFQAEVRHG
jgi:mannan endo-1,4-beta-mannosidase